MPATTAHDPPADGPAVTVDPTGHPGVDPAVAAEATAVLRRLTADPSVDFRDGQLEAIAGLVAGRARVLVVQRTGWGKSAVYFVATRLLRERGAGPTVLVSPLLALMRNQLQMAERAGVRAVTINSDNRDDWQEIEARVRAGEVDLLLISPERLNNPRFRRDVLPDLVRGIGLLVVDEAHCISDWGHDFRPDYRRIRDVLAELPAGTPVLCTTATANDRVVDDIVAQLGADLTVVRGPLARDSLELSVLELPTIAERLAWLAAVVPTLPGSGIVYCLTIADADRVAEWLRQQGIHALAYSGQTESGHRQATEEALLANEVKVVVATSALGMGFDKPDLTFVVHFQSPGSPIAYYQQVGRAGRGVERAVGVLLRGREDGEIQDWFIRTAFPPQEQAEAVIATLAAGEGPVKVADLERAVNVRRTRLEAMLKVLDVDGAVERTDGGWRRTTQPWAYDAERAATVTARRREEQRSMVDYAATPGCRMAFLRALLDDREGGPCGRCDRCAGPPWPASLPAGAIATAAAFLRATPVVLEPRLMRPTGLGRFPKGELLEQGRALATLGDGGWGSVIGACRQTGDAPPAEVLDAVADLVRRWRPEPAPAWVTWVPSVGAPALAPAVAARVAEALGVPAIELLRRRRPGAPQRTMENSAQQYRNVHGAFTGHGTPPAGPGLLVDDVADSRWTLAECGALLRQLGAGPVHPFVLATGAPP